MKKNLFIRALSLTLAVLLVMSGMITASAAGSVTSAEKPVTQDVYNVVGTPEEVFGGWDSASTKAEMTKGDNGAYSFTTHMKPVNLAEFKIIKNHEWDESLGDYVKMFRVKQACDVTITFEPQTNQINVIGDGVEFPPKLEIDKIVAAGDGSGNWLNGVKWDSDSAANKLSEVADGVYEITFNNVAPKDEYAFRFTANGNWAANWGGAENNKAESSTAYDALFDGNDIKFSVTDGNATVKLQLDLSNFNESDKTGAKYTVTVTYSAPPADYKIGDVNNDGKVNGQDAGILARYASSWSGYEAKIVNKAAADINKDGKINGQDAAILSRYTSGRSGYDKYFK